MKINPYLLVSCCAYLFLVVGIFNRKNRVVHASCMGLAMTLDIGMVLLLELQKGAVQEVLRGALKHWLLCHVVVSLIAVLLYIPTLILGIIRLQGQGSVNHRIWHIRLGISAFTFRTAGLCFLCLYLNS